MEDTLAKLIKALSPVMNPVQAEGFLHVAAFARDKPPENLDSMDWPDVERYVREALAGTSVAELSDSVCDRLREILLGESNGSSC